MSILKTLRKRGLPLFLALIMCLSLLPGTAFADTNGAIGRLFTGNLGDYCVTPYDWDVYSPFTLTIGKDGYVDEGYLRVAAVMVDPANYRGGASANATAINSVKFSCGNTSKTFTIGDGSETPVNFGNKVNASATWSGSDPCYLKLNFMPGTQTGYAGQIKVTIKFNLKTILNSCYQNNVTAELTYGTTNTEAVLPSCNHNHNSNEDNSGCGHTYGQDCDNPLCGVNNAPQHTHDYTNWTSVDDDYHQKNCQNTVGTCDAPTVKEQHSYGKWTVRTPATTEDEGLEYRTCAGCGHEQTQSIPKVETYYTVTYKDGLNGRVFGDEEHGKLEAGTQTPECKSKTERTGYIFDGWEPAVAATVTKDATYTAKWKCDGTHDDTDGDGFCDKGNCGACMHPKGSDGHCTVDGCTHTGGCCTKPVTPPAKDQVSYTVTLEYYATIDGEEALFDTYEVEQPLSGEEGSTITGTALNEAHPNWAKWKNVMTYALEVQTISCTYTESAPGSITLSKDGTNAITLKYVHTCEDKDDDGKCDGCGQIVCDHAKVGGYCTDPDCTHGDDCCPKAHKHVDADDNGVCDDPNCKHCLHTHEGEACESHWVNGVRICDNDKCQKPGHKHVDSNGDGICDGEGCSHCMHDHTEATECPSHWTADGRKLCDNPYCVETNKGDPVLTITNSYGNITVSNNVATVPYTVTVKKIGGNRAYGLGIRDTLTPNVYLRGTRTPVNHAEVTVTDIQVTVNGGSPKTLEAASGNTINEANTRGWWTVIDPSMELKDGDTAVLTCNVHIRNTGSDAIDYYLSNYAEYGFNKSLPEKQQTLSLRFGGAAMALDDGDWEITGGSNVTTDPEAPGAPSSGNGSSTGTGGSLDGNQPTHTHSYTWTETTAPTCTAGGTETGTCSCGDTTTRNTSPLGHSWGDWAVTRPATAAADGEEARTCGRCGARETRPIPAMGTPDDPTPTPVPTPDPTPAPTPAPDPVPDEPTTIDDQDVPLAGTVGLNNADHFAYVIGYDEDHVRPTANITRAEAVTIFFRLMTEEYRAANWSTENSFSDVNAGSWFNNAISTVQKAGALEHFAQDAKFLPNQAITRAEFASIAAGFVSDGITGENVGNFSDTEGHWAAEAIRKAVEAGWITGVGGNRFAPDETISRAEVMAIINRMLDRTPDADHMLPEMKKWSDNTEDKWYYADVQEATNEHDYERDESSVETWTALKKGTDWAALELGWAANGGASAPSVEAETQGLPDGI